MDISFLLPREQYAEVSKKYGQPPFVFEIKKSGQALFYFGANHSRDPNNHQYPLLKNYWNNFLLETKGHERILLIEKKLLEVSENEEIAIKTGSEGRLTTMWAHREGILVACPEPKYSEFLPQLLKQFSIEELAYYEF